MPMYNTIQYKNHRLSYYKTNFGTLFLARSLITCKNGMAYSSSLLRYHVNAALTVKLPIGSSRAPICVGLKGFQQIFADEPDIELEKLLISLNIVKDDLPVTEDIRIINTQHTWNLPDTQDVSEGLKRVKKELQSIKAENKKLRQDIEKLEQQLKRYSL